ncbi:hypothetical protein [Streptomyces sp. PTY087I2]|uniref:hypothetical protein n=1 Tax=Streptomyces sp. PTY087I2 TaxID=1819298 RepID=UPI000828BD45|nr:hypothetical protein [Streptomyces sp. PTY087I2]OCC07406.1 hypothetical protein A3Q37_06803 [Streptomyces sp. PTY087I2]
MNSTPLLPGIVWIKKEWNFRNNPFPSTGMARVGGNDDRENGLLYEPDVHADQLREAIEKFVLGMSFSGLKFGYLWSAGVIPNDSDARGFGKSVLLQHLSRRINSDFGRAVYEEAGLDESDAAEIPICSVFTSFDTVHVRSLGAALFAGVEYAVKFRAGEAPTLAGRLRGRLAERIGDSDVKALTKAVADSHRAVRGRTLGPPDDKLIVALCDEDPHAAVDYLTKISPISRSRNGAVHMATFLVFAAAAGIKHVLLCCDQLEDLASTTTAKAKRELEVERFRDVIVETLPMADMMTLIATMHPRASAIMKHAWTLADLPSFDLTPGNRFSTVELPPLRDAAQAAQLLRRYLAAAAKDDARDDDLHPFTADAVARLFERAARKPRDVLRKAHIVLVAASTQNLSRITGSDVESILGVPGQQTAAAQNEIPGTIDWSRG